MIPIRPPNPVPHNTYPTICLSLSQFTLSSNLYDDSVPEDLTAVELCALGALTQLRSITCVEACPTDQVRTGLLTGVNHHRVCLMVVHLVGVDELFGAVRKLSRVSFSHRRKLLLVACVWRHLLQAFFIFFSMVCLYNACEVASGLR